MKTTRYCLFLLILLVSVSSFAGQSGNKLKNAKSLKKTGAVNQVNSSTIANVSSNLLSFMNKVGVKPGSAKLYSLNKKTASAGTTNIFHSLSLSQSTSANDSSITKIVLDKTFGTPRLIDVQPPAQKTSTVQSTGTPSVQAMNFLTTNKSLLKISDPANEFSLAGTKKDNNGITHIRYNQTYQGLEVWGKDIYVHLNTQGNVISLTGRYAPTPLQITDVTEKISSVSAITGAINNLQARTTITNLSSQFNKLLNYSGPAAKKIIWYDKNQQPHLAWHVEVRSGLSQDWYYFIDANSGSILNSYNNVCYDGPTTADATDLNGSTRTVGTYQIGSTYYLIDASQPMFNSSLSQLPDSSKGAIICLDLKNNDLSSGTQYQYVTSTDNQWTDPSSVSANYNAVTTYQYFRNVQKRNSIDDKGMTIYSIIHVTQNSESMPNAFWSGQVMCYGDGGSYFKPFAGALDIAAHEMTHGVTQYTSNLEYQDQSGAINESMSDVFGKLVDTTSWQIGTAIVNDLSLYPSGAVRDMSNPHNGGSDNSSNCWQPEKMSEYDSTTDDNGGVHTNSGIPNHAFYFAASTIGRGHAGKIWYLAETSYLTRSSQFIDERIATEKAATEIYGSSSNELAAVQKAWDNVGVTESTPTPVPVSTQLVGQNYLLYVNTASSDANSLYLTSTSELSPASLSQTTVSNRPAVSDTSGFILFVDGNHKLRAIYADAQNPQETILDNNSKWGSVAVGPGANTYTLTTNYVDTTIYYFDINNSSNNKTFKIKTPSYDGTNASTALYADAMSFDPTGQYLLFDSYNVMKGATGEISYWTINLLNIQSGNMEVVFPAQPDGIDVDNPSFSKTTQTRFTFDYVNNTAGTYAVKAADFNTGDVAVVDGTLTDLGYPSYSGDDKSIVYHNIVSNQDVIDQMQLGSDFLTGTGTATQYISDAIYPVWFVIGSRVTDVKTEPSSIPKTTLLEQNYPNPFNPSTIINWQLASGSKVTLKIYDILGNEITTLVNEYQGAGAHSISFNPLSSAGAKRFTSGIYFYQLRAGNYLQTKKMILLK
jgi:Zn-dependent metalloprotease